MYTYSMLALDKKAYGRMSDEDQVIVQTVMNSVFIKIDAANRADNEKAYEALLTQDIQKVEPDLSRLESWRQQADRSIKELVSEDELSQQSVDQLRKNLDEFRTTQIEAGQ
jgi:TRAP-type C4-dicarboxylate transport system substrate-binding protein